MLIHYWIHDTVDSRLVVDRRVNSLTAELIERHFNPGVRRFHLMQRRWGLWFLRYFYCQEFQYLPHSLQYYWAETGNTLLTTQFFHLFPAQISSFKLNNNLTISVTTFGYWIISNFEVSMIWCDNRCWTWVYKSYLKVQNNWFK